MAKGDQSTHGPARQSLFVDREAMRGMIEIAVREALEAVLIAAGITEEIAARWEGRLPKMSQCLLAVVEETLTVLDLPSELRRRLNSTNMLERQMREIKRRTRVLSIFPNEASCLRLIGACLLEVHESWLAEEHRHVNLDRRLG